MSPPIWYVVPETSVNDRLDSGTLVPFCVSVTSAPTKELRSMDSLNVTSTVATVALRGLGETGVIEVIVSPGHDLDGLLSRGRGWLDVAGVISGNAVEAVSVAELASE